MSSRSPTKTTLTYSPGKVTSKVAGNMQSQQEAKLRQKIVIQNRNYDQGMVDRILSNSPVRQQSSTTTHTSSTYIAGNPAQDNSRY